MTDLANVPGLPPMANPLKPKRDYSKWLIIILGACTLIFGLLAIVGLVSAASERQSNDTVRAEGYKDGQVAQAKTDEDKIKAAAENPLKSYTAPDAAGAFSFKYPKNWSMYADETGSSGTLSLTLNPDLVKNTSGDDNYALEVKLSSSSYSSLLSSYQSQVKSGKMKAKDVVVSGIKANRFEGKLDSKRDGTVVILPLRDKTLIFTNSDPTFISEFDSVLSSAQIHP